MGEYVKFIKKEYEMIKDNKRNHFNVFFNLFKFCPCFIFICFISVLIIHENKINKI